MDFECGILDRLALNGSVTYVSTRSLGPVPHTTVFPKVDDGNYHGTFQDADVGLRYTAFYRPLVVTPFIGYLFPADSYPDRGHAAPGRHTREFQVGTNVGRALSPILEESYFQAAGHYAFVEKVADRNLRRARVELEIGYFLTRKLTVRALGNYLSTDGGIVTRSPDVAKYSRLHDVLWNEKYTQVGGGASYALFSNYNIVALAYTTVWGRNTHAATAIKMGINWSFATPLAP